MVKGTSTGARIGAFFAGFGILRAAALIPGIGFIVWFLVCIYGLGALLQAAWRAGRGRGPAVPPSAPPADETPLGEEAVPVTSWTPPAETETEEAPPAEAVTTAGAPASTEMPASPETRAEETP